jgi:cytoskeletal protein CcmA (bactofilin family)
MADLGETNEAESTPSPPEWYLVTNLSDVKCRRGPMRSYSNPFSEEQALASQSPFFGKRDREPESPVSRPAPLVGSGSNLSGTPVHPSSSLPLGGGAQAPAAAAAPAAKEGGSKLTVGPNIKLKGVEITDCDTLVVEGTVEATMDSRVIQIAEQGAFKGSADIDIAEIRGVFDGNLTVRDKLVIHSTGKVTGKIRYGKIVIEEGGQLSGEITFGASDAKKPALQAA